jgi:hypothetical protein
MGSVCSNFQTDEADQESIDLAVAFILRRLDLMPWMQVKVNGNTEHNNEICVEYLRTNIRKATRSWFNGGSVIVDWSDPSSVYYRGPFGTAKFDMHDPGILDKILDYLFRKIQPTF